MFRLLRKDFLFHKTYLLGIGIGYALYAAFSFSRVRSGFIPSIFGPFIFSILPIILYSREDKFKAVAFGLSLPTTRRETVAARFLLGWAMMITVYLVSSALIPIVPGSQSSLGAVFQLPAILLTLSMMTLCFGTLMPLVIRFGIAGLMVPIVVLQILGFILMIFRALAPLRFIKDVIMAIPNTLQALQSATGPVIAAAVALAVLALVNFASFKLSVALFQRKDY
jgi:ABC-type transport system involved in multi-copper enzyme maturation permease subunit